MRLINTRTGQFKWVEDPRQEHYAILSHVWAKEGEPEYPEQTYQDLLEFQREDRPEGTLPSKLSNKLQRFCETALKDGYEFGWADTCCIDKTNSSELSEAINSMYSWYAYSGVCYAFLRDVTAPREETKKWQASFKGSGWFKRGWTLQELIASRIVIFVSEGWEVLGSKHSLAAYVAAETGIDVAILTFEKSLEKIPIAQRMSWAQLRETSRLEDEAYCLMGIFGVNMQTNYSEGRYAFIRLQEKILSQTPDQTIFAWGRLFNDGFSALLPSTVPSVEVGTSSLLGRNSTIPPSSLPKHRLLASGPKDFNRKDCAKLVRLPREDFQKSLGLPVTEYLYQVFEITPYGLKTRFPLLDVSSWQRGMYAPTHCGILACSHRDRGLLALLLRRSSPLASGHEFFAGAQLPQVFRPDGEQSGLHAGEGVVDSSRDYFCRLVYITKEELTSFCTGISRASISSGSLGRPINVRKLEVSIVYIPYRPSQQDIERDRDYSIHAVLHSTHESFAVEFCPLSRRMLEQDGYNVSPSPPSAPNDSIPGHMYVLTRNPSSTSKNLITVENPKSGVYLTVQVGRCGCEDGKRTGALGVVVCSSRDADSLDGESLSSQDHSENHRIHVRSWTFDHGAASRQIPLTFNYLDETVQDARLRLVLTSLAPRPSTGSTSIVRRYRLSAEIRKLGKPKTLHTARQMPSPISLPLARVGPPNLSSPPTPMSPRASSSVDSLVPSTSTVPGSYRDQETVPLGKVTGLGEGVPSRALVAMEHQQDKGELLRTVALIALGAFLSFILLLLAPYVAR